MVATVGSDVRMSVVGLRRASRCGLLCAGSVVFRPQEIRRREGKQVKCLARPPRDIVQEGENEEREVRCRAGGPVADSTQSRRVREEKAVGLGKETKKWWS